MSDSAGEQKSGHNLAEYSVSEISAHLKREIESLFPRVRVRGEISQPSFPRSGHCYFRLKDENAVLDAVCWKGLLPRLAIRPEEGMEVIATGRITTFAGSSRYQIVVDSLELAGQGALLKLLEERRKKLAAEGLFAAERKRALPYLPETIGVVTSPTGAVIRDILHRLADRFPRHVLVWPVAVQGERAAGEVARAIRGFNELPDDGPVKRPDLLIVARGGGSLEDLWAFNEEIVVRAAAESTIPLISAVGHETDTTLIDFAADRRAPTPTAAAEMAVPVRSELRASILDQARRLVSGMGRELEQHRRSVLAASRGLPKPAQMIEERAQRLDDRGERLTQAGRRLIETRQAQVAQAGLRLRTPGALIDEKQALLRLEMRALNAAFIAYRSKVVDNAERQGERLEGLRRRAGTALETVMQRQATRLDGASRMLESVSFKSVLARGYAVLRDAAGGLVSDAAATQAGMALAIELRDGRIGARVIEAPPPVEKKPARPAKGSSRTPGNDDQGSLL
ncbi:MAG: exodeoxyribonuclease VII large subunit [Reyranellaceae bacterium]